MNQEKLEKRIAALMAKADSTTHPEEAQAFYAKAEELMLQHAIDRARIEERNGSSKRSRKPEDAVSVLRVPYPQTRERWKALGVYGSLAISEAIGLTGLAISNATFTITLYGRETDTSHVRTVIEAAWRQAEHHLKLWRKEDPTYLARYRVCSQYNEWADYYAMLNSYVLGFCQGAADRIREAREDFTQKETGTELVLANLKDQIEETVGKLPKARFRPMNGSSYAQSKGYEKGLMANLVAEVEA